MSRLVCMIFDELILDSPRFDELLCAFLSLEVFIYMFLKLEAINFTLPRFDTLILFRVLSRCSYFFKSLKLWLLIFCGDLTRYTPNDRGFLVVNSRFHYLLGTVYPEIELKRCLLGSLFSLATFPV